MTYHSILIIKINLWTDHSVRVFALLAAWVDVAEKGFSNDHHNVNPMHELLTLGYMDREHLDRSATDLPRLPLDV
jgi:hypothetical protein